MTSKIMPLIWITADNRELRLEDMETTHIRNAIARIRRSIRHDGRGGTNVVKGWRLRFLKPLVAELERRGAKDDKNLNPARLTNRFRNLDLN